MLRTVLVVLFIIDSILLVIAVLLQSGRGGGLAGALGGISSADSALGVRAASQIEKATGVLAGIFLVLALSIGLLTTSADVTPEKLGKRRGVSTEAAGLIDTSAPAGTTPPAYTTPPKNTGTSAPATTAGD